MGDTCSLFPLKLMGISLSSLQYKKSNFSMFPVSKNSLCSLFPSFLDFYSLVPDVINGLSPLFSKKNPGKASLPLTNDLLCEKP